MRARKMASREKEGRPVALEKGGSEVFEQLLISDSWRKVFGFEKGIVLHGALEFRDKC